MNTLEKCGVVAFTTAPGDGELTAHLDEILVESTPTLADLLSAATAGFAPAGPAQPRAPEYRLPYRS